MEVLETETFRQGKQRLLSKREYQFIQRQMLSPTRLVPTIRRSGGIRRLVWVGTIKGRRRKMQILYCYRDFSASQHVKESMDDRSVCSVREDSERARDSEQITLLHVCQLRDSCTLSMDQIRRMRSAVRDELSM